jgi:hypothetical protein
MKKIFLSILTISVLFVCVGFVQASDNETAKEKIITSSSLATPFCNGWDDGYQAALEGCYKVGVTPVCPVAPVGKNEYKHGYGMGYAKGEKKCD